LFLVGAVTRVQGGTTAELAMRMALVFALATILSAGYMLFARIDARDDGTLVRRFPIGGLSRRYLRGAIERVRMSDADVTSSVGLQRSLHRPTRSTTLSPVPELLVAARPLAAGADPRVRGLR
jgi:hypothetical protein